MPDPDTPASPCRLSHSPLWTLQRRWFEEAGADAWQPGRVPHYVTGNPRLANAYAAVLLGFLRGAQPAEGGEPPTVVELGAGSGRFGFLMVNALLALRARSPRPDQPFRYVLTDVAERTLAFWRDHPQLQPLFEAGVLDIGRFDAERDATLRLERAGIVLEPGGGGRAPLAVIANYVFDGLPQDVFAVEDGKLQDWLLELRPAPEEEESAPETDALAGLEPVWHAAPTAEPPYPDPDLCGLLDRYRTALRRTVFTVPTAALRCLERLATLAEARPFLLLAGDRGETTLQGLDGRTAPGLARHGSVSFPVNFDALGHRVERLDGSVLRGTHRHASLALWGALLGCDAATVAETRYAWELAIEQARPDDFFHVRRGVQDHYDKLDGGRLLALLRLSHWDPRVLQRIEPHLWERLDEFDAADRADLAAAVRLAFANHFEIGVDGDLPHLCGLLLHALDDHDGALALYALSLERHGHDPRTYWNMGLSAYALGRMEEAAALFAAARNVDPDFVPVGALQGK